MLRRGLACVLQPVRSLSTIAASGVEAVDVAAKLPSGLAQASVPRLPPLTQPLPGVTGAAYFKQPLTAPPTEITTLSNGLRIVSEASMGPTANIGIYVDSGSIYETPQTSGASALLECLAFKSTRHRDTLRIMNEVELLGANITANASREQMSYSMDCLRTGVPQAVELLADAVTQPAFHTQEVEEQKARLQLLLQSPELQLTFMSEALLRAAYEGGLAKPLIPDPQQLEHLTPGVLREFVSRQYTPPRMVLAGAGVDHKQLVELAEPLLGGLQGGRGEPEPPSRYVGGTVLLPGEFPQANLMLAFEYQGGWQDIEGAVLLTVLTFLMGGGNSFSSGGPGKGMHSRLYTRVLNQFHWVHSCSSFNQTFNHTGLVGISAVSEPDRAMQMLNVMCTEMEELTKRVPTIELERAKAMATSLVCSTLESKAVSADDVGRQYLTYGQRVSLQEYLEMISQLTPGKVAAFVQGLLNTPPSLAAFGNGCDKVPFDLVAARFGSSSSSAAATAAGSQGSRSSMFGLLRSLAGAEAR